MDNHIIPFKHDYHAMDTEENPCNIESGNYEGIGCAPESSEARCAPVNTVCFEPELEIDVSPLGTSVYVPNNMGDFEARAPCQYFERPLCTSDILCLRNCIDADLFGIYTQARQVRDGYKSVLFEIELPHTLPVIWDNHYVGQVPVQLNPSAWMYELSYENDSYLKSYLQKGVYYGFEIVDSIDSMDPYDSCNYRSVLQGAAFNQVDDLVHNELQTGKYLRVHDKPKCIHSLGAVRKTDGTYRPITDCSQPENSSINNCMRSTHHPFIYNSVDDVAKMLRPGIYSATVDISAAYRTIPIHSNHRTCQGIRWKVHGQLSYLVDTHMCFGARCAPFIFTQIGNFVTRCMNRRGYHGVLNYIDDFICFGDSFESCQQMQLVLINLLRRLGFYISWKKCSSPSLVTKYLGLYYDSQEMQMVLPEDKMARLHSEIKFFDNRKRATRRQLQRICGILSHCARVVRGGRTFSRRMCALLKGLNSNKRIRLSKGFKLDLQWWSRFAAWFNGKATIIKFNYGDGPWFATDASSSGYGIYSSGDWVAGYFDEPQGEIPTNFEDIDPSHAHWCNIALPLCSPGDSNVNFWELVPVWLAIKRYAPRYPGMHIVSFSDNWQVVYAINKGVSSNESSMNLLRDIFWTCVQSNVWLTSRYLPGEYNIIPDILSRLKNVKHEQRLTSFNLCCRCAGLG